MSATALQKLIAFFPQTQDKPRTLKILPCGPICHDCGASAQFVIGAWTLCASCAVKIETADATEVG